MNVGLPRAVSTPHQRGTVRFASGAQVPFDCEGGPGPLLLVEPEWLQVDFDEQGATVFLDRDWLLPDARTSATVIIRTSSGGRRMVDFDDVQRSAELHVQLNHDDDALMVVHDGHWVRRWWNRS